MSVEVELPSAVSNHQPSARPVVYVHSAQLEALSSLLPSNIGRSRQVHDLVRAMGLLDVERTTEGSLKARVVPPKTIGKRELTRFHGGDFVDLLLADGKPPVEEDDGAHPSFSSASSLNDPNNSPPSQYASKRRKTAPTSSQHAHYGLVDDSPPFAGLGAYCLQVAGASLAAAEEVREGRAQIAVCWDGGRHHAKRSSASGFCYVADAVLAILALGDKRLPDESRDGKTRKPRIMYIDLDIHHGDGVAEAFQATPPSKPTVLSLSIHHHAPFFFPSTSASELTSPSTPSPHTLALPLAEGSSARSFARAFTCVESVRRAWQPDFVVVCCGTDGLAGDLKGVWNLSSGEEQGGLGWAIRRICDWGLGTVLLGGGGYAHANAARAWAELTSIALGRQPLPPHHPLPAEELAEEFIESYAPTFELGVPAGNMLDQNSEEDLLETERVFALLADRVRI